METIGLVDAEARLSELLDRTANGEAFEITKHGRTMGKLVPPDAAPDRESIAIAVRRLKALAGAGGKMSQQELKTMVHEGHRF